MKKYIPILLLLASCQSDKFVGKWRKFAFLGKNEKSMEYLSSLPNSDFNFEILKNEENSYEIKLFELGKVPLNQINENELSTNLLVFTYIPESDHLIFKIGDEEIEEFEKVK